MTIEDRVKEIKALRDADIPSWSDTLVKEYDKTLHDVHKEGKFEVNHKNKIIVDYGAQKLMADRMVQMINTIPIERVYDIDDDKQEEAKNIIEAVYLDNKIDTENNYRLHAYFAGCEVASIWTGIAESHNRYGVKADTRLKCVSLSPMERKYSKLNQANLHPQFDAFDHLTGFGYSGVWDDGTEYVFFYTKEVIEEYTKPKDGVWQYLNEGGIRENPIGKIPIAYMYRMQPIYGGQTANIDAIETIESSQAQVVKRNAAPILVVKSEVETNIPAGEEKERERKTGVAREVYVISGDGDVKFVDIPIPEGAQGIVERIKQLIEQEAQLPLNLNLETLKGLGNVSGETLKQVLMGAHLKVGQEKGEIIEFLDRELRVVKHLLSMAFADDAALAEAILNVKVEHNITAFTMDDKTASLERNIMRLNNGLTSAKDILRSEGIADPERVLNEWIEEQRKRQMASSEYSAIDDFMQGFE